MGLGEWRSKGELEDGRSHPPTWQSEAKNIQLPKWKPTGSYRKLLLPLAAQMSNGRSGAAIGQQSEQLGRSGPRVKESEDKLGPSVRHHTQP